VKKEQGIKKKRLEGLQKEYANLQKKQKQSQYQLEHEVRKGRDLTWI
jgi:hypothetical protein